jgi:hypothetical protein
LKFPKQRSPFLKIHHMLCTPMKHAKGNMCKSTSSFMEEKSTRQQFN